MWATTNCLAQSGNEDPSLVGGSTEFEEGEAGRQRKISRQGL